MTTLPRFPEFPFEALLHEVRVAGEIRSDRTGTGTRSIFAPDPLRYDLRDNRVPLITSKEVPWKMALREYMWMLSGSTNTKDLSKSSPAMANIWNLWADRDGELGPTYGAQYRNAGGSLSTGHQVHISYDEDFAVPQSNYGVDQLSRIIRLLAKEPNTRRALISLWSVPELQDMALEPCMVSFQFSLRGPRYDQLELHVYQRSADMMLGVPFDLFQAGVLAHTVARELTIITGRNITASALTWSAGDVHIYSNQIPHVDQQLSQWVNAPQPNARLLIDPYPSLQLLKGTLEPGHFTVSGYEAMPKINGGAIAV